MSKLEIVGEDGNDLLVKSPEMETSVKIEDTFAEMLHKMETSPDKVLPPPAFSSFFNELICAKKSVMAKKNI